MSDGVNLKQLQSVLPLTIPVLMGYFPLGVVFGFLLVQAGAAWWLAPLMSLAVFAGAAQFLAVGLLAAGVQVGEIAFACFIVNLRHIFYGLSLIDIFPRERLSRLYCIFALTDENYSLLTGIDRTIAEKNALLICAANHFYWVAGAFVGAAIGETAKINIPGIEFSLTALFTVLAVEQYRRIRNPVFPLCALAAYLIAQAVAPAQPLFIAICIGLVASFAVTTLLERMQKAKC